jgi:hypothetical protein
VVGLSGAPCIVDGAVVGMLRSSLLESGRAVAGTLFACPVGPIIDRTGNRLPLADPIRGLPGVPRRDLPQDPFLYLSPYSDREAEVFFGRGSALRFLYEKVVAEDEASLILVFGQSGVGKSSLLQAGLMPRLSGTHAVRYMRREQAQGLTNSLLAATEGDWPLLEKRLGRPVTVILDQVEEVWTRPSPDPHAELSSMLDFIEKLRANELARPRGRLILSLRKDWLADLEARLAERRRIALLDDAPLLFRAPLAPPLRAGKNRDLDHRSHINLPINVRTSHAAQPTERRPSPDAYHCAVHRQTDCGATSQGAAL